MRNRVPHSATGKTPYLVMTGAKPSLKHVRVFGCAAYVLRQPPGSKFQSRALEGVYLETLEHGIYKVLITGDNGIPRIVESRHVTFDESRFPGAPALEEYMDDESASDDDYESDGPYPESEDEGSVYVDVSDDETSNPDMPTHEFEPHDNSDSSGNGDDSDHYHDANTEVVPPTSEVPQMSRYPSRQRRKPPAWYIANTAKSSDDFTVTTSDEPTLGEAMSATPEEREMWLSAIDDEFESLESKETWQLDDSRNDHALPTHVVLKVKRKSDGTVERFKARIVAGGNYQTYGEDYFETYAPVVSFPLVRIFLYLVLCMNMFVAQLDVKTAFLNGELDEDVWVMSPRGVHGKKSHCYKLRKAMYGLKQAHLAWHKKLCSCLLEIGFEELPSAPCVFRRKFGASGYSFILAYVDDILVLAPTVSERNSIVKQIQEMFEVRVSDEVNLFLGVQLGWELDSEGRPLSLKLSQPLYIQGMLRRFGLENSKPARTPMVETFFPSFAAETDKSVVDVELFQQMVGSLLYLALRTRLDILAPVLILARFQKSPTRYCHRAAKRILRYLRGSSDHGITYRAGGLQMQAFVDADYAGDVVDRKSMSGYLVKLGEATCIWGSKKQASVALSTCESEYYAMILAAKEIIWLTRVLTEAGFKPNPEVPLRSDNQAAIGWATGERCPSGRAKHIDVSVHFIRELVQAAKLKVPYVASEENDADIMTKPLGPALFAGILKRLGLGGASEEEC